MTACPDKMLLLNAFVDDELDAANSVAIEAHVKTCLGCAEELQRLESIRTRLSMPGLTYTAPAALRLRILALLDATAAPETSPARKGRYRPVGSGGAWVAGGALGAVAASLALGVAVPEFTTTSLQDQIVSSHVRSLLAGHLTDVATSNRHVVKPWFNGRVDFAPPVVELADQGFPLVGGRLDYIGGRVVPTLVYGRRLHTINLFIRPAGTFASPFGVVTRRDGYGLVRWTRGGLEFWAVSDIEPAELQLFHRDFVARSVL